MFRALPFSHLQLGYSLLKNTGCFRRLVNLMVNKGDYFSPDFFAQLASIEAGNWWFRSRNRLLLWFLSTQIDSFVSFLEIGCGTGFVLEAIQKAYPNAQVVGSDFFEEGLVFARERVPSAEFTQLDATSMTETKCYDLIGAFDVIEHIEQDEKVFSNLARALNTGGRLLITVPQHKWLWSEADEYACHVRRYTRTELVSKVKRAGLSIEYVTSFVGLLVPFMWLVRQRGRKKNFDPMSEFKIPTWLNGVLEIVMAIELQLLKIGVRFNMGGSLLMLAVKE